MGAVILEEGGQDKVYMEVLLNMRIAEQSDGHVSNNRGDANDSDTDSVSGSNKGTKYADVCSRSDTVVSSSSEPNRSDASTNDDLCPRNVILEAVLEKKSYR